jgi:hypothetical protein
LDTVPGRNSTDLLFPSRASDERPLSGWSKYKKELQDGLETWTLHDLRRTLRTNHARIGTSSNVGERLINHAAAVVTEAEAIYDQHTYLPEMRQAVTNYERHRRARSPNRRRCMSRRAIATSQPLGCLQQPGVSWELRSNQLVRPAFKFVHYLPDQDEREDVLANAPAERQ